eukprot:COSAG02_NODE_62899_length_264_cov_1.254545_1_plen_77_part_01
MRQQLMLATRADSTALGQGLRSLPEDLAVLLHAAASRAEALVRATGLEEGRLRAGRLLHPEVRAQGSSLVGGPGAFA